MLVRPCLAVAAALALPAQATIIEITGQRVSSLPTYIPATVEGITGTEVAEKINASDSEDALKYFPSLLVRKRYAGDYNHAVLSSRASGTGNSARSLVYADGILLSNLLGNGAAFAPRWGLVAPEEIERVDVLYGPFSAAYPGNAVGAVVDLQTRMPRRFEVHAKASGFVQPFALYGTRDTYSGWQSSVALGDRAGAWAWWLQLGRQDSESQPMTFTSQATPIDGAAAAQDRFGNTVYITGAGTIVRTVQDQAKLKLAWDILPTLRASALLADWRNDASAASQSYLTGTTTASQADGLAHRMAGLTLQSRSGGVFDWSLAASRTAYRRDLQRVPTSGGAGRSTDLAGTGWTTLAAKALWRPAPAHRVDLGAQHDRHRWRQRIDATTEWQAGAAGAPVSSFRGDTVLSALYAQDTWAMAPDWTAVLGARLEHWAADNGAKTTGAAAPVVFEDRRARWVSPKAALGWQLADDWALKLATGRAIRVPTVGELFQGNAGSEAVTNPALRPERSWTTEFSAEWGTDRRRLRATLFHEDTRDALYAQAIAGTTPIVSSVQNIDRMRTLGLEFAAQAQGLVWAALDLQASVTWADSEIVANDSYVAVPGDTIGRQQPRVPRWRASLLTSWRFTPALTASLGVRHGSRQYGSLNNADSNGFAYQGFSSFLSSDARLHWKLDRQWSLAFGIDNLNNQQYWNFHPYPQRTYSAEARFDL